MSEQSVAQFPLRLIFSCEIAVRPSVSSLSLFYFEGYSPEMFYHQIDI